MKLENELKRKCSLMFLVLIIFCTVGCFGYRLRRDDGEKISRLQSEYRAQLSLYCLKYHRLATNQKKELISKTSLYDGDEYQCIRFLCWIVEDNASIRNRLIEQWLTIHRDHDTLAPLEDISPFIRQIIKANSENQQRMNEFNKAYSRACKKKSKNQYYRDETVNQGRCIVQPLLDVHEPMSLVLFSANLDKVKNSIMNCEELNYMHLDALHGWTRTSIISIVVYKALEKIRSAVCVSNSSTPIPTRGACQQDGG